MQSATQTLELLIAELPPPMNIIAAGMLPSVEEPDRVRLVDSFKALLEAYQKRDRAAVDAIVETFGDGAVDALAPVIDMMFEA